MQMAIQRKPRPTTRASQGEGRHARTFPSAFLSPTRLDLLADLELQHGHHLAAERLAQLAAELREGGR